jgi:hypothetical protein
MVARPNANIADRRRMNLKLRMADLLYALTGR